MLSLGSTMMNSDDLHQYADLNIMPPASFAYSYSPPGPSYYVLFKNYIAASGHG